MKVDIVELLKELHPVVRYDKSLEDHIDQIASIGAQYGLELDREASMLAQSNLEGRLAYQVDFAIAFKGPDDYHPLVLYRACDIAWLMRNSDDEDDLVFFKDEDDGGISVAYTDGRYKRIF